MKEEIKEILNKLRSDDYYEKEYQKSVYYERDLKKLEDCITNLQEIAEEHKNCTRKHWQQKCAEHCANEMIYKSRNEKAIENIDLVIELIKQQPTEDDTWILNRLNGFKFILKGDKDD